MSAKKDVIEYAELFHEKHIHIPSRTIYLGHGIYNDDDEDPGVDHVMVENFLKNFHLLETVNKDPITIIMNTPGGSVFQGMAIYDTIKVSKCHVTIIGKGEVASMGSIILQVADDRVLSANTTFMIHDGEQNPPKGHKKTVKNWLDYCLKLDDITDQILFDRICEKHPDFKMKKLREVLQFDFPMTAADAVALGLADRIES